MVSPETIALLARIDSDANREPMSEADGIAEIATRKSSTAGSVTKSAKMPYEATGYL